MKRLWRSRMPLKALTGFSFASTLLLLQACSSDDNDGTTVPPVQSNPPVETVQNSSYQTLEDQPINEALSRVQDGDIVLNAQPVNGTLVLNTDGTFTYTPNADFHGSDGFTYSELNGDQKLSEGTVQLVIEPVNDAPTVAEQKIYAYTFSAVTHQIIASDIDSNSLTYSIAQQPSFGEATLSEDGLIGFEASTQSDQTDSVIVNVSDGEITVDHEIEINIASSYANANGGESSSFSIDHGSFREERITLQNAGPNVLLIWPYQWPEWINLVSDVLVIAPFSSLDFAFELDASVVDEGTYNASVLFGSGEPGAPDLQHDISLEVSTDITPPGQVGELALESTDYSALNISFTAVADNGERGLPAAGYDFYYSRSPFTADNLNDAQRAPSDSTPMQPGSTQIVTLSGLEANTTYYVGVFAYDEAREGGLSPILSATTADYPRVDYSPENIQLTVREADSENVVVTLTNNSESTFEYTASLASDGLTPVEATPQIAKSTSVEPLNLAITKSDYEKANGRVLVKMASRNINNHSFSNLLQQLKAHERRSIDSLGLKVIDIAADDFSDFQQTIEQLKQSSDIVYVEAVKTYKTTLLPTDPRFSEQWSLQNEGQTGGTPGADIAATLAWNETRTAENIVVAVVDTGIDYTHPDLDDNIWINPHEIADNGIDDDNNGYIDDIHGIDTINGDSDPMDDHDHGTHCAGIIGAEGDNDTGIVGVVHNVQLMALKGLDSLGRGTSDVLAEGIVYAVDNGARVISASWGGSYSQAISDAIAYAETAGVLFVTSAGNSSDNMELYPSYPGALDHANIISVASTTHDDTLSYFSNYGITSVDLGAPGSDILSTVVGGGYDEFSGTSMAAPHVSGAVAMLMEFKPELTPADIKSLLMQTSTPLGSLEGKVVSGGRLQIADAIALTASSSVEIVDAGSGSIPSGESTSIELRVSPYNVVAGDYSAELTLETNSPVEPEVTIPISVEVQFDAAAPSAITDLSLVDEENDLLTLSWSATGDDGSAGYLTNYQLAVHNESLTVDNWHSAQITEISTIRQPGIEIQHVINTNTFAAGTYYIAVRAIDNSGQPSAVSNNLAVNVLAPAALSLSATSFEPEVVSGSNDTLELNIVNTGGKQLNLQYELIDPNAEQEAQEDTFGYRSDDNKNDDYPEFEWVDLGDSATSLTMGDDSSYYASIGFEFPYYDQTHSNVYISSNGFLSFTSSNNGCCTGYALPYQDNIHAMIAWAWRDLHQRYGTVKFATLEDRFVVEYDNYGIFGGIGSIGAQISLFPNGRITMNYRNPTESYLGDNFVTGMENHDSSDGFTISTGNYFNDGLSIEITPPDRFLTINNFPTALAGGESQTVSILADAQDLSSGTYERILRIQSNDPLNTVTDIPITLMVLPAP